MTQVIIGIAVICICLLWAVAGWSIGIRRCAMKNHCIVKQAKDTKEWTGRLEQQRIARRGGHTMRAQIIRWLRELPGRAIGLVWPITKRKLHRLLHLAGVAITAALMVEIYHLTRRFPWDEQLIVTATPVVSLLTKWQAMFRWADANVVNHLPVPEGSGPTEAVPDNSDQLEDTGVHGKGDL